LFWDLEFFALAFQAALGLGVFLFFFAQKRFWFLAFLFSNRLPGGGITFFAAAKKVIKESSFSTTHAAHFRWCVFLIPWVR
jgi:hypothetical protein